MSFEFNKEGECKMMDVGEVKPLVFSALRHVLAVSKMSQMIVQENNNEK